MPKNGRKNATIAPIFSAPPSSNAFANRFIEQQTKLWDRIEHSALYPNCTLCVKQIGDEWYPLPKTLPNAFHDGTLRCDFSKIDADVLEKCPWFWEGVVLGKAPYLDDKEYLEDSDRLVNLEKETEEVKLDLEVFEPELPELEAKCSSLTNELLLARNETDKRCGEKEDTLKDANDIRESLLDQNEALEKEIESLKTRLHSLQ